MHKTWMLLLLLAALTGACRKSPPPAPPPAASPTPIPQAVYPAVLGIPECDEYLFKLQSCLQTKVPDLAKIPLQIGMDRATAEWKKRAAIPQNRPEIGSACLTAMQASKKAMTKFQCQW